ncbi:MAG: transglycosylase domain-containing protein [Candidatus Pacebacteria bacterium]|nr:transglycosylase domain-containing protein [Candidatus Paceibacterota bacterium]
MKPKYKDKEKQAEQNKEKKQSPKKRKNLFLFILKIIGWGFAAGIAIGLLAFFFLTKDLPRPEVFTENQMTESTKIYDRTGQILLASVYDEEKRTYVPLSQVPDIMQKALIATEDANFYNHFGIDLMGILRAIKINFSTFSSQGASTIDQQLIRSTFLTPQKTISRKVKEVVLAIELDRRYPKDQILEWYLNQIPFGINIYGVEEASLTYFQKPIQDVTLAEAAMLAASVQAPSYYSPYGQHVDELMQRKNYVLKRMAEEGYISAEQRDEAQKEEITISKAPKNSILAYHFVEYVKEAISGTYGSDFLQTKGLKIYTTLDWEMQKAAEQIVEENVAKNRINYGAYNAATVVMDPKTGEILAMIGSADPWADPLPEGCDPAKTCKFVPSYNVATQGLRQPGSSFKPIVYASAFRNGFPDTTTIIDQPTCFGIYCPRNYDGLFHGTLTLRQALAQSLNVPAVKTLNDFAGLQETVELAKIMGISTLDQPASFYGLPFALGAGDVRVIDMATAYSVFANGGYRIDSSAIMRIEDTQGNILYEDKKTPRKVLEKDVCDMITDVLSDNNARAPIFGYNSLLRFDNYKVAVKTGTTQDSVDGWTIGYSPDTVVAVWAGNNNRAKMSAIGETAAGPIWRALILKSIELKTNGSHQESSQPVEPGSEVPIVPD